MISVRGKQRLLESRAKILARYAATIRTAYTHEMRQFLQTRGADGANYRPSRRWEAARLPNGKLARDKHGKVRKHSEWWKAAKFALENCLEPRALVRAAFYGRRIHPPRPNHLSSAALLERYTVLSAGERAEIATGLKTQAALYVRHVDLLEEDGGASRHEATLRVLLDRSLRLTPLLRYCLAVDAGLSRASSVYLQHAVMQFMRQPELYEEHWKDVLPAGFSAQARELYRELAGF